MMADDGEVNHGVVWSPHAGVVGEGTTPLARIRCSTTTEHGSGHKTAPIRTEPPRVTGVEGPSRECP
jgi:hypothetical protein